MATSPKTTAAATAPTHAWSGSVAGHRSHTSAIAGGAIHASAAKLARAGILQPTRHRSASIARTVAAAQPMAS
jgi:hypothetical protein